MSLFEKIQFANDLLSICFGCVAYYYIVKYRISTANVIGFFSAWVFIYLFEFFAFGSNSYIHMDEEGDHYLPYFNFLLNHHLGGQFGHHVGGGVDIFGSFIPSVQLISPELYLLSVFPVWIAYLIHLFVMCSVGFGGSYLICRTVPECPKSSALAISAFFTVSTYGFLLASYPVGLGLSFLPLAIYVFVCRLDHRAYFRFALPLAAAIAVFVIPTWTAEAIFAGVILSSVILAKFNFRLIIILFILVLFMLINWAEPLNAITEIASWTDRGSQYIDKSLSAERLLTIGYNWLGSWNNAPVNLIFLGLLIVFWKVGDPIRVRCMVGFLLLNAGYLFAETFPWHSINLGPVNNLSHHYVMLASTGLVIPLLATAAGRFHYTETAGFLRIDRNMGALILALSVAALFNFKIYNIQNLLYHGGQSQYHTIKTLTDKSWMPAAPYRAITLRVREFGPEPAIPYGFYGIESFDAFMNMRPSAWAEYYNVGILKRPHINKGVDSRIFADWSNWKNGQYREIEKQVSLPMLALANVRFILSPLPIESPGLTKVAGPATGPVLLRDSDVSLGTYLADRIRRIFVFNDLYVYEIPNAYPQVFAADRTVELKPDQGGAQSIELIRKSIRQKSLVAVVRSSEHIKIKATDNTMKIVDFNKIQDGYDVFVDAPKGGLLVVNTYAAPYWTATANTQKLDIFPVNQIQMGVMVPPGSNRVLFSYHRPTVVEKLKPLIFQPNW